MPISYVVYEIRTRKHFVLSEGFSMGSMICHKQKNTWKCERTWMEITRIFNFHKQW